jgi:hypothetical protein
VRQPSSWLIITLGKPVTTQQWTVDLCSVDPVQSVRAEHCCWQRYICIVQIPKDNMAELKCCACSIADILTDVYCKPASIGTWLERIMADQTQPATSRAPELRQPRMSASADAQQSSGHHNAGGQCERHSTDKPTLTEHAKEMRTSSNQDSSKQASTALHTHGSEGTAGSCSLQHYSFADQPRAQAGSTEAATEPTSRFEAAAAAAVQDHGTTGAHQTPFDASQPWSETQKLSPAGLEKLKASCGHKGMMQVRSLRGRLWADPGTASLL